MGTKKRHYTHDKNYPYKDEFDKYYDDNFHWNGRGHARNFDGYIHSLEDIESKMKYHLIR